MEIKPPSPASSVSSVATSVFCTRISDRNLTEIELHSVESINDLHRTHQEHNHKGSRRPPLPPAPSTNGNFHHRNRPLVYQAGQPIKRRWQSTVRDLLTPMSLRYSLAVAVIALMLLTTLLIFYFLVQQGSALQSLTKAVREIQVVSQQLKELRNNLTALTGGP